jgi:hypothetical protein
MRAFSIEPNLLHYKKFPATHLVLLSPATRAGQRLEFSHSASGKVTGFTIGSQHYRRRPLGPEEGSNQLK